MHSTENEISGKIIGAAIEAHHALGPGLLESAYQEKCYIEYTLIPCELCTFFASLSG